MNGAFVLFDHTADLGVRACAADLPSLVRIAAEGLYAAVGQLAIDRAGATEVRTLEFTGGDSAVLLRDFLDELLYRLERDRRQAVRIGVMAFTPARLGVEVEFAPLDEAACRFEREVKAVTYHELAIREVAGGYEAVFIVDI